MYKPKNCEMQEFRGSLYVGGAFRVVKLGSLLILFKKGEKRKLCGKLLGNRFNSPNRHYFEMNQKGEFVGSNFLGFDYLKIMSILLMNFPEWLLQKEKT